MMLVMSNNPLYILALLLWAYLCSCSSSKRPLMVFTSRTITQFSYEDSKLDVKNSVSGSNLVCGAMCLTSGVNCTGFKLEGHQCHVLQSWSFAAISDTSENGIEVHEMNVSGDEYIDFKTLCVSTAWSKVMILGGKTTGYVGTPNIELIDLANAKHCTSPTPFSNDRYGMPSFVLGSKLLTIGGSGFGHDITSYNFKDHIWESVGTLAASWGDYSLGRIQDSWILLMGGDYDETKTDMTMILNANGSMVPGPNLPMAAKGFCACGLDDNHIFIAGGKTTVELNTAHVLDWNNQQWTALDPMALPRYYVECGVFLSSNQELSILVVGGLQQKTNINPHTEIYNWPQRSWRAGPDFAIPKIFLSRMTSFDGKLFLFGGYDEGPFNFVRSIYTFIPTNETWVRFPLDLNIERRDFGIMMIPDEIVEC